MASDTTARPRPPAVAEVKRSYERRVIRALASYVEAGHPLRIETADGPPGPGAGRTVALRIDGRSFGRIFEATPDGLPPAV